MTLVASIHRIREVFATAAVALGVGLAAPMGVQAAPALAQAGAPLQAAAPDPVAEAGWRGRKVVVVRHHYRPRHRPYVRYRPYRPVYHRPIYYRPIYHRPVYYYGPRCFWRPARTVWTPYGWVWRPARRVCRW